MASPLRLEWSRSTLGRRLREVGLRARNYGAPTGIEPILGRPGLDSSARACSWLASHVPDISWLVLNCYQAGRLNGDCPIAIGAGQGMSVTPLAPKKMTGGRGKFSQAMKASPELVTHKTNGRSPLAAG